MHQELKSRRTEAASTDAKADHSARSAAGSPQSLHRACSPSGPTSARKPSRSLGSVSRDSRQIRKQTIKNAPFRVRRQKCS
jgi:hypothetical protein